MSKEFSIQVTFTAQNIQDLLDTWNEVYAWNDDTDEEDTLTIEEIQDNPALLARLIQSLQGSVDESVYQMHSDIADGYMEELKELRA